MSVVCREGFQAFAPVDSYTVRPGGRGQRVLKHKALCPGYLFARLPHGYAAHRFPLVRGVVAVDGEPLRIPDRDIAYLQVVSGRSERVLKLMQSIRSGQVITELLRRVAA
jgi:transcription antitermination factor NusG